MSEKYSASREFSNTAHKNVVVPKIYDYLSWTEETAEPALAEFKELKDTCRGVDYEVTDITGKKIKIQERIRRNKYKDYADFTIRYEREFSLDETEKLSENFKLQSAARRDGTPFYFVYVVLSENEKGFEKFLIADINRLMKLERDKKIVGSKDIIRPEYKNGVLYCPVKNNTDKSSSMITIDVFMLMRYFPGVILYQEGYDKDKRYDKKEYDRQMAKGLALLRGYVCRNTNEMTDEDVARLLSFLTTKRSTSVQNTMYGFLSNTDLANTVIRFLRVA